MSEANTAPPGSAASLYPPDGGAAAAAAGQATQTAPAGTDTLAGGQGADTLAAPAGGDTAAAPAGNDSITAGETGTGTEAAAGNDTLDGGAGNDSITAESYQFTLPEGFTEDAALTTDARSVMLEAGVKPEKAQALIDLFGKAVKAANDKATLAFQTEQQGWLNEINKIPEFQGPTRETSLQSIGRLFDEFGTPEAKAALDRGGIGNNPALAKMMLKIATALSEGAPATQGGPAARGNDGKRKPQTVGESLYPNAN